MLGFLIFTACRTNEVLEARWSEIDRTSSTWRIPGARMKMNQDHVVPLSDPALAILDRMRQGKQRERIFPNPEGGVFSENAMLALLHRLGYGSRDRARLPVDIRDLGRGMHRLSRWRS
jgi:integrase